MIETKENHMDWIISHVKGEKILEVGCSIGETSIALGRVGKQVTGIDICRENIKQAKASLESEEEVARSSVDFVCAGFMLYTNDENRIYDSIIIEEFPIYLDDARSFIGRSAERLIEGGVLLFILPLAIRYYENHRRTYYLKGLHDFLSAKLSVVNISFHGEKIMIACSKGGDDSVDLVSILYLKVLKDVETQDLLQVELKKSQESSELAWEQYSDLAGSKLGRVQRKVWELRSKKREMLIHKETENVIDNVVECEELKMNFDERLNPDFIPEVRTQINDMPTSEKGRYYRVSDQKIAIIADEFLFNTYKNIANMVPLHPADWRRQIEGCQMLLITSTWKGLDSVWRGLAEERSEERRNAINIIECCKALSIPTAFYSKEDPPNYKYFVEFAKHCDVVFTTAIEVVEDYKRDCGHQRVYPIMFGINPLFHNPVGFMRFEKRKEVIFSGSWLDKYPERGADICAIFDGVLSSEYALKVLDRNYSLKRQEFAFPVKYADYISPEVPHEILQKIHKLYNWALNINSVKESQTMFANRVYELEAVGNLLISNYSAGINLHLPLVYTTQDSNEVARILGSLSPREILERQLAGIRHAMTDNTIFDRFAQMCEYMGLPVISQERTVGVVVNQITDKITEQFDMQSFKHKELCLTTELPQRFNEFDMIAFWDEEKRYDFFYLEDMINAFKYTSCDYVTKDDKHQHDYVQRIKDKYLTVFWRESFEFQQLLDMPDTNISLPNGYSIDYLHFSEDQKVEKKLSDKNYKLSVIIPVYNNGLHLYGKAFASLLRSSMFDDMEILLIDDGSTDIDTLLYVQYIANRYENVRPFFFADGGSGSVSRPCNKGVEMSTSEYIAFLEPENEAISDGYAKMVELTMAKKHDIVVGNVIEFREKSKLINYYQDLKQSGGSDVIGGNKKGLIRKLKDSSMSIQAMLIEKKLVTSNSLEQVEGIVEQDLFFVQQLVLMAKSIKTINLPIYINYTFRIELENSHVRRI